MGRKVVILLGHPGVGKGTQAKEIMRRLNIPQISTGDMLRDAIVAKTEQGLKAKGKMDAGDLVSDDIVNAIVAERIQREDCANGFILDGYPRNVQQAETFRAQMEQTDHVYVFEISADSSRLVDRLVGRLMCPGCGDIYNIYSRIPKVEGVCDRCGKDLVRRSDDRPDLIHERFRTYDEETFPLVEYYRKVGAFHNIDGTRPIAEVTREILETLGTAEALAPTTPKGGDHKFA